MASDLSSFLKDELSSTLEQLLSKKCIIDLINDAPDDSFKESQCIKILVKFEFQNIVSTWSFIIPTAFATKLEYFMLGGMGDLKDHLDDEILDATSELISNVCGSFCTSINAQNFADVSSIKSTILDVSINETSIISDLQNKYEFHMSLEDEKFSMIISFDNIILSYLSQLGSNTSIGTSIEQNHISNDITSPTDNTNEIDANSSLSQEATKNLQLLMNIKLKLSVRLGTKLFLLKDVLQWDIGKIIELEQMVNEPLEILINGVQIGEGEAVIVEGKFGLKIKNIKTNVATLNNLGL